MGRGGRRAITGLWVVMMALFLAGSASAADRPAVELEQAIQVVRQNFEIPAEFTDFSSSLNQYEGGQAWYLSWNRPDQTGGSFSAQVDADTGEVTAMNKWQPQTGPASRVSVVSWSEARQTAAQLLQRVIPARMESLVMIEDEEPSPLSSSGPVTYTINWRRVANQIPVDGIGAWVNIDATNGEVVGYSLNWSHLPLPEPKGVVNAEAARRSFTQNDIVKLEYRLPEQWKPLTTESEAAKPMLVYIIDHPSNGAIDAFTGQPLIPDREQLVTGVGGKGMGGMAEDQAMNVPIPLTPQEQEEIENLAGLITREKAADIVLQWADMDKDLVLRSASLDKDWSHPDTRIWSLSWSAPTGTGDSSLYLYGRVNARSGELLSFTAGLPRGDLAATGLSQAEARRLAEDFLRRVQAARFEQFQLNPDAAGGPADTRPVSEWPTWSFRFNRIHEGIPFPGNGAEITVDRVHNRVTSYVLTWDYSALPPADDVIGLDKAAQIYLQEAPLTLTYSAYYSTAKGETEMRLVYLPKVPDGQPGFRMLDALDGTRLDNQGRPVLPTPTGQVFNDITGNFAAQEIELLGKAGLMTEYGEQFHPGEAIKLVDLTRAMLGIYQGSEMTRTMPDTDVIKQALARGWLKEEMAPETTVPRSLMAQVLIRSLGLEYLAEIPEIYRLPYRDADSIAEDTRGYAALCWGLGIIRADGVRFESQQVITRAEAAAALVNSLRVKR
ncbi:MAG TPA: hypothetical protein P5309_03530 [Syntrophomonadaceae bacterium]|nr:hypothetical protein [Syntrophomonadaceae bacterium]